MSGNDVNYTIGWLTKGDVDQWFTIIMELYVFFFGGGGGGAGVFESKSLPYSQLSGGWDSMVREWRLDGDTKGLEGFTKIGVQ